MFELTLVHQFARQLAQEVAADGTQFHVNTLSQDVCSSAGGGATDCNFDHDATL